jgi:CubicO group peptidase (beta-lactamase class C family)
MPIWQPFFSFFQVNFDLEDNLSQISETIPINTSMNYRIWMICFWMICAAEFSQAQIYYPPRTTNVWDTLHPSRLGWCDHKIDSMMVFLEEKNTKAFIVLKDGKMVLEKYFGTFTQDSLWYWASAGKSLAASVVGIAENQGYLKIEDPVSKYLGKGWTACPPAKEDLITIRHQITMTTGLNENLSNSDCTESACLIYKADAGTRWFYHNAPYTLTHDVVEAATGKTFNMYTYQNLSSKIGMSGLWFKQGYNDLYISKARDMARYGLLVLGKGIWQGDTVLKNRDFVNAMTQSSQTLNKSYGYLWWLNGKGEIIYPGLPTVFKKDMIPSAPADLFAGLGKNDQKLYVVPSENLIVVRMGNAADGEMPALSDFDEALWAKIANLKCVPGSNFTNLLEYPLVYPNPFHASLHIKAAHGASWKLTGITGNTLLFGHLSADLHQVDVQHVPAGVYFLHIEQDGQRSVQKLVKTGSGM